MAENVAPKAAATNGDSAAGLPFYEKQRQHLKELLAKKRNLDKKIVSNGLAPLVWHPVTTQENHRRMSCELGLTRMG